MSQLLLLSQNVSSNVISPELEILFPSGGGGSSSSSGIQGVHCFDVHGRVISRGVHYVPGPDACVHCVCDVGGPQLCRAILCGQPPEKRNCKPTRVGTSCCEFICPDEDWLTNGIAPSSVDMGVVVPKIIITAILSLLSISLLFFLVNRLRQRGRMANNSEPRRLGRGIYDDWGDDTRSLDYAIHDFGRNASGFGYPPQYMAWWRKPYIPTGEAPPPYEEAITSTSIPLNPLPPSQSETTPFPKPEGPTRMTFKGSNENAAFPSDFVNVTTHETDNSETGNSHQRDPGPSSSANLTLSRSPPHILPGDTSSQPDFDAIVRDDVIRRVLPSYSELIPQQEPADPGPSRRSTCRSLTLPRRPNLIINPRQDGDGNSTYQRHSFPLETYSWNSSSCSSPSPSFPRLERQDLSSPSSSSSANT